MTPDKTLSELRLEHQFCLDDITRMQADLTQSNAAIRQARLSQNAQGLREATAMANDRSLTLAAIREHSDSLKSQISQLESQQQAQRIRAKHEAKVLGLVNRAKKAGEALEAAKTFELQLAQRLKNLMLKRQNLNSELKIAMTDFWNFGETISPGFYQSYEQFGQTTSDAKALLSEIMERTSLEGVYVPFGPAGGRYSSSLGNPEHFLHGFYPVDADVASHLARGMHHLTAQNLYKLPMAKLEERN